MRASLFKTLKQVFPFVYVFSTKKRGPANVLFFASRHELDASQALDNIASVCPNELCRKKLAFVLQDYRLEGVDEGQGMVLTDDFNPSELLGIKAIEECSKSLVRDFGNEVLLK